MSRELEARDFQVLCRNFKNFVGRRGRIFLQYNYPVFSLQIELPVNEVPRNLSHRMRNKEDTSSIVSFVFNKILLM